jgi:hypothetical protein
MGKAMWTVFLVVVLVLAGGAWWLYSSMDSLVATAIRSYGPDITGVSVKVGGVKIRPTDGAATVRDLQLGNPAGFKTERALFVGAISMKLNVASLTKDLILVQEITIEEPEVTYEYASGGSNLDVIQRHVEAYIAAKTDPKDAAKPESKKKIIIEHLYIKGARAKVSAEVLQGKTMTLPMADMHLTDIGKKANGVSPAEATQQVVSAITKNASKTVAPLKLGSAVDSAKKGVAAATDAIKGLFK